MSRWIMFCAATKACGRKWNMFWTIRLEQGWFGKLRSIAGSGGIVIG